MGTSWSSEVTLVLTLTSRILPCLLPGFSPTLPAPPPLPGTYCKCPAWLSSETHPVCGFKDSQSELIPNGCLQPWLPTELSPSYPSAFLISLSVSLGISHLTCPKQNSWPFSSHLQYRSSSSQQIATALTHLIGSKIQWSWIPCLLCSRGWLPECGSVSISGSQLFPPLPCLLLPALCLPSSPLTPTIEKSLRCSSNLNLYSQAIHFPYSS